MDIVSVDVSVSGEFGKEGEPASNIHYSVTINAPGYSQNEINDLIHYVDRVAEVHNTLRRGVEIKLA